MHLIFILQKHDALMLLFPKKIAFHGNTVILPVENIDFLPVEIQIYPFKKSEEVSVKTLDYP